MQPKLEAYTSPTTKWSQAINKKTSLPKNKIHTTGI